jgi:hypothetical protein
MDVLLVCERRIRYMGAHTFCKMLFHPRPDDLVSCQTKSRWDGLLTPVLVRDVEITATITSRIAIAMLGIGMFLFEEPLKVGYDGLRFSRRGHCVWTKAGYAMAKDQKARI